MKGIKIHVPYTMTFTVCLDVDLSTSLHQFYNTGCDDFASSHPTPSDHT